MLQDWTALHHAASLNHLATVGTLLERQVAVSPRDLSVSMHFIAKTASAHSWHAHASALQCNPLQCQHDLGSVATLGLQNCEVCYACCV